MLYFKQGGILMDFWNILWISFSYTCCNKNRNYDNAGGITKLSTKASKKKLLRKGKGITQVWKFKWSGPMVQGGWDDLCSLPLSLFYIYAASSRGRRRRGRTLACTLSFRWISRRRTHPTPLPPPFLSRQGGGLAEP